MCKLTHEFLPFLWTVEVQQFTSDQRQYRTTGVPITEQQLQAQRREEDPG